MTVLLLTHAHIGTREHTDTYTYTHVVTRVQCTHRYLYGNTRSYTWTHTDLYSCQQNLYLIVRLPLVRYFSWAVDMTCFKHININMLWCIPIESLRYTFMINIIAAKIVLALYAKITAKITMGWCFYKEFLLFVITTNFVCLEGRFVIT